MPLHYPCRAVGVYNYKNCSATFWDGEFGYIRVIANLSCVITFGGDKSGMDM